MPISFKQCRDKTCIIESLVFIVKALIYPRFPCTAFANLRGRYLKFSKKALRTFKFAQWTHPKGSTRRPGPILCLWNAFPCPSITAVLRLGTQLKPMINNTCQKNRYSLRSLKDWKSKTFLGDLFHSFIAFCAVENFLLFQNMNTSAFLF